MKSIIIVIDGVGPVLFERSAKARRMNISVRPGGNVRVAVPRGVLFTQAEHFVYAKRYWVQKHLTAQQSKKAQNAPVADRAGDINRTHARTTLITRLNELAGMHGFTYGRVFIKNQKTRWGSCSVRNNINLNMNLIRLPRHLIDYVLLHELVHTRIRNHSVEFWLELDMYVGNARKLRAELNAYP
ncbi:MAG TPA: DUF45 domain-containing protein [Deltaproteobacteria bacterium]|nr:DUF45 domain-containing protein [Deltaproteobacteria bacterium]